MIPTIIGIMTITFVVIQFAPGGPVEQVIAQLTGQGGSATDRFSGGGSDFAQGANSLIQAATARPNTAVPPVLIPNSLPNSKSSSASTSRRLSAIF